MKKQRWIGGLAGLLLAGNVAQGQERPAEALRDRVGSDEEPPAATASMTELERQFAETMTGVTLTGRWCLVEDGQLGEEKSESYTIRQVQKVGPDEWLVYARIQYGERDLVVPVPVQVKWAGDTPVISLTDLQITGLGRYTARVVVFEEQYAGTWSGGAHKGLIHGVLQR